MFPLSVFAEQNAFSEQVESEVVKGASYAVCDGAFITGCMGTPCSGKFVSFFTYDGNLLVKKEIEGHSCCNTKRKFKLDPLAPKPQPVSYQIKYWPGIIVRIEGLSRLWFGRNIVKGVPGDFIIFCDKHGNRIKSYRFDKNTQQISIFEHGTKQQYSLRELKLLKDFSLDLSMLK